MPNIAQGSISSYAVGVTRPVLQNGSGAKPTLNYSFADGKYFIQTMFFKIVVRSNQGIFTYEITVA